MLDNPFITYGYESAEYFCDRKSETKQLIDLLTNGNHVALISPRRMGKTGLLHHCFCQTEIQQHYHTFLIDIYATKNLQDFVFQMGRSIVNRLKSRGQKAIDRFLQIVTSLRTGITFDGQGNATWNLDIGEIKSPSFTLEEIFSYLQSAERHCIVAIDEFQAITQYPESNVEAMIRTYVQQCRNSLFIFSGSQQSMMSEIFISPARPFYQSVSMMFLQAVPLSEYEAFADYHFESRGRHIESGVVKSVYERYEGITWYVQRVLNQLYAMTEKGETVMASDVERAENHIIAQNEEAYKDTLFQLSVRQRDLVLAISKEGKARQITSSAFVKRHHLTSASSVQKASALLVSKQILTHRQGIYEIYDKFFSAWLRR